MKEYASSFSLIELTDERLGHIFAFHPEIRSELKHFSRALEKPDFIKPSRRDPAVVIFYRAISKAKTLAIVIKVNARHFILTAYLVNNIRLNYENKN